MSHLHVSVQILESDESYDCWRYRLIRPINHCAIWAITLNVEVPAMPWWKAGETRYSCQMHMGALFNDIGYCIAHPNQDNSYLRLAR